ncbi:MAG TPA: hypothetical protein PKO15_02815 [Fibrobacteria bacterium]|nr:hypothetical protein [Fibrobacteria bacterium]
MLDWNETAERCHNSLDRSTGATGSGEFAPFSQLVRRYGPVGVDLHAVLDPTRLGPEELRQILTDIGSFGYGRNATTGEGRFEVETFEQSTALGPVATGGAGMPYLILANMAPQGLEWVAEKCWYAPETRFGRHGSQAALWGRPFKNPILMARTGGVFTPKVAPLHGFVGQGVGGRGELSRVIPETVHQGYAPVVPLRLEVAA